MMGFKEVVGDIAEYCGDVIINSVGVESKTFGGICGAIVANANSIELKEIIDGVNNVYSVGEYFFTEGYQLPTQHIFHLITPHHDTDTDCKIFKECIRRTLNECQFRGWYKIGFPVIGTGANTYDFNEAKTIIKEMCQAYCDDELYPHMEITMVVAKDKITTNNDERIKREAYNYRTREYHNPETIKKFKKGAKYFSIQAYLTPTNVYDKDYFKYDEFSKGRSDLIIEPKCCDIGDYVETYVSKRGKYDGLYPSFNEIKKRINIYFGYGKKGKDTYSHSGADAYGEIRYDTDAPKKAFFKIIFALKMSLNEARAFLGFYGHCFANRGVNKVDDTVKSLIQERKYGIVEIEQEFKKNKISKLSIFKK